MRSILVTGGNKGIGLAVCQALLEEAPDTFVYLGSRDKDRGHRAIQSLAAILGPEVYNRVQLLVLDVSSPDSVHQAAQTLQDVPLYALVNNAGVGKGLKLKETLNTNYWGVQNVTNAFLPNLALYSGGGGGRGRGRIVNVSSMMAPVYVSGNLGGGSAVLLEKLAQPWLFGSVANLNKAVRKYRAREERRGSWETYAFSKAALAAYTYLTAREEHAGSLLVNAVEPGFVATSMTAGMGAPSTPAQGARPIVFAVMDTQTIPKRPQGRLYGADGKRSPWHKSRSPGQPEYQGPDGPQ